MAMILGLVCAVFATAYLGNEITRESSRVASVWLANGVVLLALLKTARGKWGIWLACGLAGNLAANLAYGDANWLATTLSLCNTLEVVVVGLLFRHLVPQVKPDLARIRTLFLFIVIGGVAGPALAAALAASILHGWIGLSWWTAFRTWFAADALGLLILLLLVAVTTVALLHGHAPWIFLLSPVILWAAFRFGFVGVASAIFLATACGIATIVGEDHAGHLNQLRSDIAFLQIFIFTMSLIFLPVASVHKALRESVAQFRLLFDRAPMGMAITDADSGLILSANPRLEEILGYRSGELLGHSFMEFLHPDHRDGTLASIASLAAGGVDEIESENQYVHRTGP
jgi:PAS domain S-box-containing protein